jgi:hypothetical protein
MAAKNILKKGIFALLMGLKWSENCALLMDVLN